MSKIEGRYSDFVDAGELRQVCPDLGECLADGDILDA